MGIAKAAIEPNAPLIAEKRRRRGSAEVREVGYQEFRGDDPALLIALPIAEEENAIAPDGTAKTKAELPALKEGARIRRIATQPRIGREFMIAEKVDAGSVEIVASGSCDDIDRAGVGNTGREIEIDGRDLEFLNDFL